jgi:hypothetical protein
MTRHHPTSALGILVIFLALAFAATAANANPEAWKRTWPRTDFTRHSVPLEEIIHGGPPKDGIPSIDRPVFVASAEARGVGDTEPVISLEIGGDRRAYPLQILIWHEIVNDIVGGVPVAVTYCPLCNSAIVFERRLEGRVLEFGTTGNLRNSDLVMYDRQTESWWQQFTGLGIVGEMTGKALRMLPVRVESFGSFKSRMTGGKVLAPNDSRLRPYGINPYEGYDTRDWPILFRGQAPEGIAPLAYVVRVGDEAWSLDLLRERKEIVAGDLRIRWTAGKNSVLDAQDIVEGRDIGNVTVERRTPNGYADAVHDVTFAFAFQAFVPNGRLHLK